MTMTQEKKVESTQSVRQSRWQRFTANVAKRNPVTAIILYGIQAAAVICSLAMILEMIDMICDFREPHPLACYEGMTIGGLILRMLSKGWLAGMAMCIVVFFCNRRVIKWNADGILWMFNLLFVISMFTLAVEDEMFIYFSVSSISALAMYVLSLLLPKRVGGINTTTFQQCLKPANRLITLSFLIFLLWCITLSYSITHF